MDRIDFERVETRKRIAKLWQDPEAMRAMKEAFEDVRAGRVLRLKRIPSVQELLKRARAKGTLAWLRFLLLYSRLRGNNGMPLQACRGKERLSLELLHFFSQLRDRFEEISNEAIISDVEDWCFRIFVDRHYYFGIFHSR